MRRTIWSQPNHCIQSPLRHMYTYCILKIFPAHVFCNCYQFIFFSLIYSCIHIMVIGVRQLDLLFVTHLHRVVHIIISLIMMQYKKIIKKNTFTECLINNVWLSPHMYVVRTHCRIETIEKKLNGFGQTHGSHGMLRRLSAKSKFFKRKICLKLLVA